jgi:hypothetical protein
MEGVLNFSVAKNASVDHEQGDQIGRMFAFWVSVFALWAVF